MNDKSELNIGHLLKDFCAQVGKNPLLVQGAGGNASWKDNNKLWVKASGTWLVDSQKKDIFVPVELDHLKQEVLNNNFSAVPRVVGDSNLKPSIETLLHALMPHKVVVHLHAIEILSHLVRLNPEIILNKLIKDSIRWRYVEYFKPGEELAKAVSKCLSDNDNIDVIFLKNHGVVIGGSSVPDIDETLNKLLIILKNKKNVLKNKLPSSLKINNYSLSLDSEINQLANNKDLSKRLSKEWVLYPDHAVFLGGQAAILHQSINIKDLENNDFNKPDFIFVLGEGVFERHKVSKSKKAQLRCYYEVLIRQPIEERLSVLPHKAIIELLNWDAEKYRQVQSL